MGPKSAVMREIKWTEELTTSDMDEHLKFFKMACNTTQNLQSKEKKGTYLKGILT